MIQWIIIGLLVVFSIYLIIKLRKKIQIDERTLEENKRLEEANIALLVKRKEVTESLDLLQQQAKDSATKFYEENIEKVNNNLQIKEKELLDQFNKTKEEYNKEYLQILNDAALIISEKNNEISEISKKLLDLQQVAQAAVDAEKRKQADAL